jgi:hypothetical protein
MALQETTTVCCFFLNFLNFSNFFIFPLYLNEAVPARPQASINCETSICVAINAGPYQPARFVSLLHMSAMDQSDSSFPSTSSSSLSQQEPRPALPQVNNDNDVSALSAQQYACTHSCTPRARSRSVTCAHSIVSLMRALFVACVCV